MIQPSHHSFPLLSVNFLCTLLLYQLVLPFDSTSSQPPAVSVLYNLSSTFSFPCKFPPSPVDNNTATSLFDPILVSKAGNYAWGFTHSPDDDLPMCSLSIVCYNCKHYYPVWSTCCDQSGSVYSEAAMVKLGSNRDLQLLDATGSLLWSANTKDITSIELLETGNLLLLNSRNSIVWQSFHHPSNVLVPGQKLTPGMGLEAGDYSAVMEAGGLVLYVNAPDPLPYLVLNSSWGLSSIDDVLNPVCKSLSLVYAADGTTLMMELDLANMPSAAAAQCDANDGSTPSTGSSILKFNQSVTSSRNSTGFRYLKLNPKNGGLETFINSDLDFSWFNQGNDVSGRGFCSLPSHCGEFGVCDPGGECRCPNPLTNQSSDSMFSVDYNAETPETDNCPIVPGASCTQTNSTDYKLLMLQDLDYFPHRYMSPARNSSLKDCKDACLQNCTCLTAFYNNLTQACHHYRKTLSMQRTTYGADFLVFIKILPEQPATTSSSHRLNFIAIAIIFGTSLLVCCVIFLWVHRMYDNRDNQEGEDDPIRIRRTEEDAFLGSLAGLPPRYSVKQLQQITNGFSEKLGAGSFGSVYQGVLSDGSKIAVKKLEGTRQGDKEFRAEVAALAGLSHVNLVRLRGFCAEGSHRMLVYEHMTNGSLDRWLSRASEGHLVPLLDWPTRFRIALGTARGLAFLHGESRERIFHLDIKPQNILLDEKFVAKLADFGLSKQMDRARSRTETSMRGTPGYLAPEWLLQGAVTDKSDVYSFGMVLLELVSGRRNVDYGAEDEGRWFWPAWAAREGAEGRWGEVGAEAIRGPPVIRRASAAKFGIRMASPAAIGTLASTLGGASENRASHCMALAIYSASEKPNRRAADPAGALAVRSASVNTNNITARRMAAAISSASEKPNCGVVGGASENSNCSTAHRIMLPAANGIGSQNPNQYGGAAHHMAAQTVVMGTAATGINPSENPAAHRMVQPIGGGGGSGGAVPENSAACCEAAARTAKVAFWCLQEEPKARPTMMAVLLMLEGHVEVTEPPMGMRAALEAQARLLAGFHPDHSSPSNSSSPSQDNIPHPHLPLSSCFPYQGLSFNPLEASPTPCLKPALSI